ncbi:NYN domain-containing protein [Caulobacter segnis]|uniref:NYN domain-containing protein n=1 Tax=Caulobacter segnis TaxID=88688 RepID=UPI00285B670B|nr:NYN domain-containing protein [Caulobacter segnis]MDR6626938.1 hypothetical protein [Caulobacter segnis]
MSDRYSPGRPLDLKLAGIKAGFTKVFYYDALEVRGRDEPESAYLERTKPHRDFLDELAEVDGIHVYEGDAHRRRKRGLEQKKVDVMIAVDMLSHTFRQNMQRATLLTSDVDFKPLLDALVQNGMFVTLWYPPGDTNRELINAADARRPLGFRELYNFTTAETQQRLPLPILSSKADVGSGMLDYARWSEGASECRLCVRSGEYHLLVERSDAQFQRVSHPDVLVLRAYASDYLGLSIPLQLPEVPLGT